MTPARKPVIQDQIEFDPARMARRLKGSLDSAGVHDAAALDAKLTGEAGSASEAKARKGVERAVRRAGADLGAPMVKALRRGAQLPQVAMLLNHAWRVELVDAPEGEVNREAAPAWVVRFEGNAPIQRLARAGMLSEPQVLAAEKVAGLYLRAFKPPRVTASYDGVGGGGGGPARPWLDVACDSWRHLKDARATLLPVEDKVIMEVVIYESPIEALAKRPGIAPMKRPDRAYGAVVQSLRSGLARLTYHWGLDWAPPHDG